MLISAASETDPLLKHITLRNVNYLAKSSLWEHGLAPGLMIFPYNREIFFLVQNHVKIPLTLVKIGHLTAQLNL